ncbi:MAG: Eco57I restriction-modification methylase domain-containing protein [Candidatus Methanospirareceae archaeon]
MKEAAKEKVKELVERFRTNIDVYKRSTYNETQVRREFIDPFFEALGWDVSNAQGYAEQYKEVIHEDAIKVGRSTKAPDYSFRIGGQRKFFVEAKKPAVNIKADISPSYQLRRYAWSAKLPLSILTDFEELSVFDCQIKPQATDKTGVGRIAYYTFEDYLDRFDEIYDVFSKEAILKGSFDRYAESTKGKKGTAAVDTEFLKEIETWRELLAKNIALRNPDVTIYELNYAVQKIIDRVIFLRICEDRGIEPYGQLQTKAESNEVYKHLLNHFKLAESKYDSGIFDFEADRITPALHIDDKVLKTIIRHLYYPESPYEFSVLGVEILGNVYEQFLGKVIRLTAGHQAKVETKPEVKKAGGVYYTPQYIVDYIVKNTVGKLITGKTPDEIAELKILDPACGSGSFLIGAYTYLLKYHLDWYISHQPKKHKNAVFQVKENEWYLTTAEKKRILINNIFGVDIDQQAVEVTKLSLLLKVLENESRESINQQVKLGLEGILPNLEDNIKCGNSLIGPDFYETQQTTLFNEDEMRRINVFDWNDDKKGFGKIMKRGGYDCVIGNPPWGATLPDEDLEYLRERHSQIIIRMIDSFMFFLHKSSQLLSKSGLLGVIIPSTFLTQVDNQNLRRFFINDFQVNIVINLGTEVFGRNVLNTSTILVVSRVAHETNKRGFIVADLRDFSSNEKPNQLSKIGYSPFLNWKNVVLSDSYFTYFTRNLSGVSILSCLKDNHIKFRSILDGEIQRGITPDYLEAFVIEDWKAQKEEFEPEVLRKVVLGQHVSRYGSIDSSLSIIYLTRKDDIKKYPNVRNHLALYRDKITCREVAEGKHPWFSLHRPRNPGIFKSPKFIGLTTTRKISVVFDESSDFYATDALYIFKLKKDSRVSHQFVLGVLHSNIFGFLYQISTQGELRVIPQIKATKLYDLPFPKINLSDPEEKAQHDKVVSLVENMLYLQKKYHEAKMERDKELYERQIKIVDAQIDKLVYDLYGLTEEEIKVVEGE